ncbi:hypothetical protein OS493_017719 [Desmophyllum pertusum]|uniref:Uncharacterized protein n=1 Tax=Desmophyllum pertusum TaxID=174260 RepID=A0A9X0CX53_9CNID|nr:hypothetical protein OS493_017719 [Desmophyllum pertusum]
MRPFIRLRRRKVYIQWKLFVIRFKGVRRIVRCRRGRWSIKVKRGKWRPIRRRTFRFIKKGRRRYPVRRRGKVYKVRLDDDSGSVDGDEERDEFADAGDDERKDGEDDKEGLSGDEKESNEKDVSVQGGDDIFAS